MFPGSCHEAAGNGAGSVYRVIGDPAMPAFSRHASLLPRLRAGPAATPPTGLLRSIRHARIDIACGPLGLEEPAMPHWPGFV
jgi:hypothetical protein